MELAHLIEALSAPAAYPHHVDKVEVHQTHISVVFVAGSFAYKVKKPVNLGFLNFSTLERRRHFCEEEMRLNRRLAPEIYLGIVPVSRAGSALIIEGPGEAVEWAVKMKRLPEEAALHNRLQHRRVGVETLTSLAGKVASFHDRAEANEHISAFGRFDVVASNARENFDQVVPQVGTALSQAVFERLRALTEEALAHLRPLINDRAERGVPRDTHGDLRLDHIYLFPNGDPPADLVIIDCIEFSDRFRFADPISDMAFLVMDLRFHGRRDLAWAFAEGYFRASGDEEGRALLPFYVAYRAAVRGKVEGFELLEKEIPESDRIAALAKARAHWLLALGELATPGRKPCLVLVGGLPGTGKSTLAQGLALRADFCLIRSDLVRKELAGLACQDSARCPFGEGIYAPAWTERTYAECLCRAEKLLFEGKRVIVDASFGEEKKRHTFLAAANQLGVPAVFVVCEANAEAVRQRLHCRRGDASDADWATFQKASERWEDISPVTREAVHTILTEEGKDQAISRFLELLRKLGLAS
jgi:aminoglycoside phosphotransferase family enzyme/predicted kinase